MLMMILLLIPPSAPLSLYPDVSKIAVAGAESEYVDVDADTVADVNANSNADVPSVPHLVYWCEYC